MKKYAGLIVAALTVIAAIVGCIALPDTVVTQISGNGGGSTMSKYFAMLVPAAINSLLGYSEYKNHNVKYAVIELILFLAVMATLILNLTVFA